MFADPGVGAVNELRLVPTSNGVGVQASVAVISSSVDIATVRATIGRMLADAFGVTDVILTFIDPGPEAVQPMRGVVEKK